MMEWTNPDKVPEDGTFWFRAEAKVTTREARFDYDGDFDGFITLMKPRVNVFVLPLRVLRTTPKGVWLRTDMGDERFVLREARKRYACPTRAEAIESLTARMERRRGILSAQLRSTEILLKYLKEGTIDDAF